MGQEIVYCSECQIRITGREFESGVAFRAGNRVYCKACFKKLPPEARPRVEEPPRKAAPDPARREGQPSTTRIKIAASMAPAPKKSPLLWGGAGGAGAVALVLLMILASRGKTPPPAPPPAPPPRVATKPPPDLRKESADLEREKEEARREIRRREEERRSAEEAAKRPPEPPPPKPPEEKPPEPAPRVEVQEPPPPPPPPPPPAPDGPLVVFSDALAKGWRNNSWDIKVNLKADEPPPGTGKCIAFTTGRKYSGLYLHSPSDIDAARYPVLAFRARATRPDQKYLLGLYRRDASGKDVKDAVDMAKLGGNPPAGEWKTYEVPVEPLGAAGCRIYAVIVQDAAGNQPELYVDDIRFLPAALPQK
jgi:hypothetical protein